VILLKRIEADVREAAKGVDVPIYVVPFPGMGQQAKFLAAMAQSSPASNLAKIRQGFVPASLPYLRRLSEQGSRARGTIADTGECARRPQMFRDFDD
jgi:hypothetical protein